MKRTVLLLIPVVLLLSRIPAQTAGNFAVSGMITDRNSGEHLPGATIWFPSLLRGASANAFGHFSLTIPAGTFSIEISFVGYQKISHEVHVISDTVMNWSLIPGISMDEIDVRVSKKENILRNGILSGIYNLSEGQIGRSPSLLGEPDALKVLQLLPGVKTGNEGTSGMQVRGGSHDQNLILLDGVPVYNTSHLFGYFSAFNTDAIKNIRFYKGGIPARYGGRLSSVVDVAMKEGNNKKAGGQVSLSPVSGRLTLEGPLKKEAAAFMVSARRSWLDIPLWLKQKVAGDRETSGYSFYDLNAKVNWIINQRNHLYLSHYQGMDGYFMKSRDSLVTDSYYFRWGNFTTVIRWNYNVSPRIFINTSVYRSLYRFGERFKYSGKENSSQYTVSGLMEYAVKSDMDLSTGQHALKLGYHYSWQCFQPEMTFFTGESGNPGYQELRSLFSQSVSGYAEDEFSPFHGMNCNAGIRIMAYFNGNECTFYPEPRISAQINLNRCLDLNVSVQRLTQTIQLLTNNALNMPTDLWVPSGKYPAGAWLLDIGLKERLREGMDLEFDLYYKPMENLLEYKPGVILMSGMGKSPEELTMVGRGLSFGAEWMLEKSSGRLTGWLGYALSRALRKFDIVNDGKYFPYKYDRRHHLTLMAGYSIKETLRNKLMLSLEFVLASGNAVTFPDEHTAPMLLPGMGRDHPYLDRFSRCESFPHPNNYRMPPFHHLDVAFSGIKKLKHGKERTWNISVYNIYNRLNPCFYFKSHEKFMQISMLPVVPSVSWSLKF